MTSGIRGGQPGLDEARGHRVDADPALAQRRGERVDQADHAGLAGGVVGLPPVAGDPGDRGDRDDPPAGRDQVPFQQHVVDALLAGQVDVDHLVPPVGVHPAQRLVPGDAGVVHHHVDPAVPARPDAPRAGSARPARSGRAAPRCRRCRSRPRPARPRRPECPAPPPGRRRGPAPGQRRADAPGRAGHQHDLPVQRPVPVGRGARRCRRRPGSTWPETYADRPDSRNRSVDSRLTGCRRPGAGHVDQLGGDAPAELLADAADQALQRTLGGGLAGDRRTPPAGCPARSPDRWAAATGPAGGRSRRAGAARSSR